MRRTKLSSDKKINNKYSSKWINLAEERLGAEVLFSTDDFFAEKENLIRPGRGIFIPEKYTDRGKWMDGWESRRKRVEGHDYCDIKLGLKGVIKGFDIDTNHFLGNHPPEASVEACFIEGNPTEKTIWFEILPKKALNPGSQNIFEVNNSELWSHVRLHIYPDGGVARFRVYGEVKNVWDEIDTEDLLDLAAVENEGKVLHCNDMFFSSKDNLIMPGRGINMGDGWETKRRRAPGHDWVIVSLGNIGTIKKVEVDTAHFKGNYPDSCSLEGVNMGKVGDISLREFEKVEWKKLLGQSKLAPDWQHLYEDKLFGIGDISHVRMNIFPDGGISRLRLYGVVTK